MPKHDGTHQHDAQGRDTQMPSYRPIT